jgi:hypothetical protein
MYYAIPATIRGVGEVIAGIPRSGQWQGKMPGELPVGGSGSVFY